MWMIEPGLMCDRHLLGEHVECHMLAGTLAKGRSIAGFVTKELLEPASLQERHDRLADEMCARGFSHRSPLPAVDLSRLPEDARTCRVDPGRSYAELLDRCEACSARKRG